MKLVSIILPTHNRAATLARSIKSVLEQIYSRFELIVVDDASADDTAQVLNEYADARLHVHRLTEQRGAAGARNFGIAQAKGEFIAFQDSDDEWLPEKLSKQMSIFDQNMTDLGVVYADMMRITKEGNSVYYEAPQVESDALVNRVTRKYCVENLGIVSCVIKRECLESVGNFNETLPALEDLELFVRLSEKYRFHHIHEALVNYYETDSISSDGTRVATARRLLLKLFSRRLKEERWFIASELSKSGI